MNEWQLHQVTPVRFKVVNRTGLETRNVQMWLEGSAVATSLGNPDWKRNFDSIAPGEGPIEVFTQGWGGTGHLVIHWSNQEHENRVTRLRIP